MRLGRGLRGEWHPSLWHRRFGFKRVPTRAWLMFKTWLDPTDSKTSPENI